MSYFWKH